MVCSESLDTPRSTTFTRTTVAATDYSAALRPNISGPMSAELEESFPFGDPVPRGTVDGLDGAGARRGDRVLHLHGLDDHEDLSRGDLLSRFDRHRYDHSGQRGGETPTSG